MIPSWESVREAWPLIAAVAALWGRLEIKLARGRDVSERNSIEIKHLEDRMRGIDLLLVDLTVRNARMEERLDGIRETVERIDRKIS